MRLERTLAVRCSDRLYRAIGAWAKQTHQKPSEVSRQALELAFGVEEEQKPVLPGIKKIQPTQLTPSKT